MKLADVQCTPIRFEPGDRILVRVHQRITPQQSKQIRRTVEKWAGNIVEVLVIDMTLMDIEIQKLDRQSLDEYTQKQSNQEKAQQELDKHNKEIRIQTEAEILRFHKGERRS